METQVICKQCKKPFLKKRGNMAFCSDKCRSAFNNTKAKALRDDVFEINMILKKNRGILKTLHEKSQATNYSKDYLLGAGFDFSYFTSTETIDNMVYNFSYDYGVGILDYSPDRIIIVKK